MDTEVYVFCPKCNEIVDGIGTGKAREPIICRECGSFVTSNVIGQYRALKKKKKRLYFPEDF